MKYVGKGQERGRYENMSTHAASGICHTVAFTWSFGIQDMIPPTMAHEQSCRKGHQFRRILQN